MPRPSRRAAVAFASQVGLQRRFAEKIAHGPVNRQAIAALDPSVSANLPTAPANLAGGVGMDAAFWAANGAALEERRSLGQTLIQSRRCRAIPTTPPPQAL